MAKTNSTARRRRVAIDPRLVVGVLIVAASVAGVMGIVGAADKRITVFAASEALTPGQKIDVDDLVARSVALDGADRLYLTADEVPKGGLVVTRVVRDGELIPVASVGSASGQHSTSIVLELGGQVSAAVVPGASVDVWAAPASTSGDIGDLGAFGPPTVLTSDAVVVRVLDDDGLVSAGEGVSVEVLVPRARIARLLQAMANGDELAVVPAGLPLEAP